jgi:hypothetical protein
MLKLSAMQITCSALSFGWLVSSVLFIDPFVFISREEPVVGLKIGEFFENVFDIGDFWE